MDPVPDPGLDVHSNFKKVRETLLNSFVENIAFKASGSGSITCCKRWIRLREYYEYGSTTLGQDHFLKSSMVAHN
jgi:hypothetical protein